jgi:DnaJ-class molecular chaperone
MTEKTCPDCNGTGIDFGDGGQCQRCDGTGEIFEDEY